MESGIYNTRQSIFDNMVLFDFLVHFCECSGIRLDVVYCSFLMGKNLLVGGGWCCVAGFRYYYVH